MSRFSHYGSGQRLAFAMMCVGFVLCIGGAVAPFWMKSEVKMSDVSFGLEKRIPYFGDLLNGLMNKVNLLKVNLGVWVFCFDSVDSETKCYSMYSVDEGRNNNQDNYSSGEDHISWITIIRIMIAVNVKLSLLCGIIACCRCLCCSGGRTICHGIFAFLAGASGFIAVAIMAARRKDIVAGLPFVEMELDWAFFVYTAGCSLMVLSSLFLCFAVPKETPNGMVMMQMPAAGAYVAVTNSSTNYDPNTVMTTTPGAQYELNGQIQSFEPLPEQPVHKFPTSTPY